MLSGIFGSKLLISFKVRILTDAVDDITTVDDFLAVSESHILDDVNRCITALQVKTINTITYNGDRKSIK